MKVHFLARVHSHYFNHLVPVFQALPEDIRGSFFVMRNQPADRRAKQLNIPTEKFRRFTKDEIVVVASYEDYRATGAAKAIYFEHGAGQTYKQVHVASYAGNKGKERTILFVCPSERVADINRSFYPSTPAVAAGVPYLDQFWQRPEPDGDVVAISHHANIGASAETRWAFPHYRGVYRQLAAEFNLLGHAHPRVAKPLGAFWAKIGVPFEPDWWKVLEQASVFCVDNSSALFEAMACDIPVVIMSQPSYRRDVEHGLRFWRAVEGQVHVEAPEDLANGIRAALDDPPQMKQARCAMVQECYGDLIDGKATARAVQAICDVVQST